MKYHVPLRTTDYVDVTARSRELGIRAPVGIALLPGNFRTAASANELRYHGTTADVRTAWRSIGLIDGGPFRTGGRVPGSGVSSGIRTPAPSPETPTPFFEEVPLAVFFGAGQCSGPAALVTLALGSVASVLTLSPGYATSREIRLDAVVERPSRGGYVCLEYRGDACELLTLARAVREIWADYPPIDRE